MANTKNPESAVPNTDDERIVASVSRDDRSSADLARTNDDGTALTIKERMQRIRSDWNQEVLPTPPKVPGWHFCWLSTTNSADPIYKRMQKGYQPVYVNELEGFSTTQVEDGEFKGVIACNEMLLFKIEAELYNEIMKFLHHELPMSEEEYLKANAKPDIEDKEGTELGTMEGFTNLARNVKAPTFF